MPNFELNIDERAFKNRGVDVNFNEFYYSLLVSELAGEVPADKTVRVQAAPAPIWGVDRKYLYSRSSNVWPDVTYKPSTYTVSLKASEEAAKTNHMLLIGTYKWLEHLDGTRAKAQEWSDGHRWQARAQMAGAAAIGGVIGTEALHGGLSGLMIAGLAGGSIGAVTSMFTVYDKNPYASGAYKFADDQLSSTLYKDIITYSPR